jgi:hypothetical protein
MVTLAEGRPLPLPRRSTAWTTFKLFFLKKNELKKRPIPILHPKKNLPFNNATKDNVLTIQPLSLDGGDEELGTVGTGTSVSHGQETGTGVLEGKVLISKLVTVDGLTTGTVVVGEVTTLEHELGNDTVEDGALVTVTVLTSTESTEVLSSLGDNISSQFHDDTLIT